jgi:glycosyltransferase involved in cell wall biosynthesis
MSAPGKPITVALVDPLWIGHHPMYFSQFTTAFLRAGARVIGLCPEPESATREAIDTAHLRNVPDAGSRISMHHLPPGKRSWFNNRYEGDPWHTFRRWQRAASTLRAAEAATGWKADMVYFPYLDSYLRFLPFPFLPDMILSRPWSGLYLRNHHYAEPGCAAARTTRLLAKGDMLIRSNSCLGIGVLDERFLDALRQYTGKEITAFPDATSTDLPAEHISLSRQILDKARGRKIIGLIGLERRKGLLTILRAASAAHKLGLPWFFVCAGIFGREAYTDDERRLIDDIAKRVRSGDMDNLHFDPDAPRLPTDTDFNSLFTTFDVAWAAYEDFHGSSNALTKAAFFDIPALATAGECIGTRVDRFRIGLTIPEANVSHALDAIRRLLDGVDNNDQPLNPHYAEFRDLHSLARLDKILADLLRKVHPAAQNPG